MRKTAVRILDRALGNVETVAEVKPNAAKELPTATFSLLRKEIPLTIVEYGKSDTDVLLTYGEYKWRAFEPPLLGQRFFHQRMDDDNVCITCEDVEVRNLLSNGGGTHYQLGWYKDIANCRNCGICQLLTFAFEADADLSYLNFADGNSGFVILDVLSTLSPMPRARRERPYELRGLLIGTHGRQLLATARIRASTTSAPCLGKPPLFHARIFDKTTADLSLARNWIDECYSTHASTKHPFSKQKPYDPIWGDECLRESYEATIHNAQSSEDMQDMLRLIDVQEGNLCFRSWNESYVALSYVWPRFESLRLVKSNSVELHRRLTLFKYQTRLPKVIWDAMEVVRRFGQRYLWVDALCITQNDEVEKAVLINAMDRVYGESYLTLVVASNTQPSNDYGIPGINGTPRTARQCFEVVEGVQLVTALAGAYSGIAQSVWSTRGWTFQEGLLAQHCLIMSDQQMFFRCPHDYRSEDVQAECCGTFTRHPARPDAREEQMQYVAGEAFLKSLATDNAFYEYSLIVQEYTSRNFTDPKDILNGFVGITTTLLPHFPSPRGFFCGLPQHAFDRALLWYPTSHLERREAVIKAGDTLIELPTWSWAGWKGSVSYEKDAAAHGDVEAQKSVVMWWRSYRNQLVPIKNHGRYYTRELEFGHCMLAAQARNLKPTQLVFFGICIELSVSDSESYIDRWTMDWRQTLPCFALLDSDGDPCGMLPSADRKWAERHVKSKHKPKYQFLLLAYASQSRFDQLDSRTEWVHPKYEVPIPFKGSQTPICFYYVMLLRFDDEGIAYRCGIGRVHRKAVDCWDGLTSRIIILG